MLCVFWRVTLYSFVALAAVAASAQEKELQWHDAAKLPLEGRAWSETAHPYDRLPAKAEGVVRAPVWDLSHHSAGMSVRFVTNASVISARWSLRGEATRDAAHAGNRGERRRSVCDE